MLLFLISFLFGTTFSNTIVVLPMGQVLGYYKQTLENKQYLAFEGIPYAKPPLGSLRFQPPVPPDNWSGVLNCTNFKKICVQTTSTSPSTETEDCLYLNIYTPIWETSNISIPLPVMVFVHGGQFLNGDAKNIHPDLFLNQDILVVTLNYRVGIFGFLTTEDSVIPGNNGLRDQQMAIAWISKNINFFGGDDSKITIFGQSAGAASIAFQLAYQGNTGLFRSVILDSGTFLCPWSLQRSPRTRAFGVGTALNLTFFKNNNSQDLLNYLQNVPADLLQNKTNLFQKASDILTLIGSYEGYNWAPVIEPPNPNAFLTQKQYTLLKSGNLIKVPTLMGFNSEETLASFQDPKLVKAAAILLDLNSALLVPVDMEIDGFRNQTEMGRKIKNFYTNGTLFATDIGATIRFFSDDFLNRAIIKHAALYSNFAKVYFYEFGYDGILGHLSQQYNGTEHDGHNQELYYSLCYNDTCDGSVYPKSDQLTRQRLVGMWSNFIKYLDPTPNNTELLQNIMWPSLDTRYNDFYYLNINGTLEIRNRPKKERVLAWDELYNALGYDDFDTY